jgi:hypothetical protein
MFPRLLDEYAEPGALAARSGVRPAAPAPPEVRDHRRDPEQGEHRAERPEPVPEERVPDDARREGREAEKAQGGEQEHGGLWADSTLATGWHSPKPKGGF